MHWFEGTWGRQVVKSAWGSLLHFIQYNLFWASLPLGSLASAPASLRAHWPSHFLAQRVFLFPAPMAEGQCPKVWPLGTLINITEYTRKLSEPLPRILTDDDGLGSPGVVPLH